MYECIIFDIDGTLLDTRAAILGALKEVLAEVQGRTYPERELEFIFGIPGIPGLKRFGLRDVEDVYERWIDRIATKAGTVSLYEGMEDALIALKFDCSELGIVTSRTRREITADLQRFGLADLFVHVIGADDTKEHKPNPEPLLRYLAVSGKPASKALYIGDTIYDARCAAGAGIDFGLAAWGKGKDTSVPARYLFRDPREIVAVLKEEFPA